MMIDRLKAIAENNKGVIYTKDVIKENIRKEVLSNLVKTGELVRLKRGVYCFKDEIIDEYYLFQLNAPQLIYSLGTALFFHGYSSRVPNILSITVRQGYNVHRIDTEKVSVRYSKDELFELGLTKVRSPQGMDIRCYDLERTICDIIKERNKIDPQIFSDAINQYFSNKKINSRRLMKYANILKVDYEIMKYIEVLR